MLVFKNILSVFIVTVMTFLTGETPVPVTYPVPPSNDNSLFYIQRSKNTNAIVYEMNRNTEGKMNMEDPVRIYWIRYTTDSTTEDLSLIQRKYAYGVTA